MNPIEAELPDGTILEFPAGTPDAIVQARVRERLGVSTQSAHTPATQPSRPRSAASRFLEPLGKFAQGLYALPDAIDQGAAEIARGNFGGVTSAVGRAILDPQVAQGRRAGEAFSRGDFAEAAGHAGAAALPGLGPAAADIGEALGAGNVAGAAGQAAVGFTPGAHNLRYLRAFALRPTAIAGAFKRQAGRRMFNVLDPAKNEVPNIEGIVDDLVGGISGIDQKLAPGFVVSHEGARGIGVGSLDELTARAHARRELAGKKQEALKHTTVPIHPGAVSRILQRRARQLETTPPSRTIREELPVHDDMGVPLLDDAGDPIMGINERRIAGVPQSGYEQKVAALRSEAARIDRLAEQYPDHRVPSGELFKFRDAVGQRASPAYVQAAGVDAAVGAEAAAVSRDTLSQLLKKKMPEARIADREYQVFNTAWEHFENHRRANLTNKGLKGLKDLIFGRLFAGSAGAALGLTTGTPAVGAAGAVGGIMLADSAYWGSLRAKTYSELARHLNSGHLDQAAQIIQSTSAAYAVQHGITERERHRSAQRALQEQAEGVVAP